MVHPEVWINSALQLRKRFSLTADRLLAELQIAQEARLGVVLKFSVGIGEDDTWFKLGATQESTIVYFGNYLLDDVNSPAPAEDVDDKTLASFVSKDLWGIVSTEALLHALEAFPDLPQIVVFLQMVSWRMWQQVASGRAVLRNCVWVCKEALVTSEENVRELLQFRGLGPSAQYFFTTFEGHPTHIILTNPSQPGTYGVISIRSEAEATLFEKIVSRLGLRGLPDEQQFKDLPLIQLLIAIENA